MKNLPISKKLFVTFGIILALLACTVILGVIGLFSTGNNFDSFYEGAYNITNRASDLQAKIESVSKYVGYAMMEEDKQRTAEYIKNAENAIQVLREGTQYLYANFEGDKSLIDTYDSIMQSIKEERETVFELAKQNKNEEAIALYFSSVMPQFEKAYDYLTQINDTAAKDAVTTYNSARSQKNIATIMLISLTVITFTIAVIMALYLTRSITLPVKEIEAAAKKMSEGSLDVSITYESRDEIGSLSDSMKTLTYNVKTIIEDIGRILSELSKGNFLVTSNCLDKYIQDYIPILEAMRFIRDNLNSTFLQISEASQQVAMGAGQMAQSAQGLAEGATEQAGAIEELTATVENVAAMAEESAESAKQASQQVKTSAEQAESSRTEIKNLTEAMERISNTSKEIENIIAAIEDIASQTSLLSLNASIEAARAGEAGKGFAVVADQIGKLASDSAQSAVNTKELISKTLEEIETGNFITSKTSKIFEDVLDGMKGFAKVAQDSSETSTLQFNSLKQIRQGIEQISSVVQSNSAAAGETSATSEELSAQADNLEQQVSKFKLIR